jgi:hypothetical protein
LQKLENKEKILLYLMARFTVQNLKRQAKKK